LNVHLKPLTYLPFSHRLIEILKDIKHHLMQRKSLALCQSTITFKSLFYANILLKLGEVDNIVTADAPEDSSLLRGVWKSHGYSYVESALPWADKITKEYILKIMTDTLSDVSRGNIGPHGREASLPALVALIRQKQKMGLIKKPSFLLRLTSYPIGYWMKAMHQQSLLKFDLGKQIDKDSALRFCKNKNQKNGLDIILSKDGSVTRTSFLSLPVLVRAMVHFSSYIENTGKFARLALRNILYIVGTDMHHSNAEIAKQTNLLESLVFKKTHEGRVVWLDKSTPMLWQQSISRRFKGDEKLLITGGVGANRTIYFIPKESHVDLPRIIYSEGVDYISVHPDTLNKKIEVLLSQN